MKKIMNTSLLALAITLLATACNSSGTAPVVGDSVRLAPDSATVPSNMSPSNTTTNADTSTMLNNNVGKDSMMMMDSSKIKPKMK